MKTLDNQFIGILPKSITDTFGMFNTAPRKLGVFEELTSPWELEEGGTTFECTHELYHGETIERDTLRNGEHTTYEVPVMVCDDCGADLDMEPDYE